MYDHVKKTLLEVGELMVRMSDGQTFELHIHNTAFDDNHQLIIIEAAEKKYWLKSDQIIYSWIHRVAAE